jgi:hypothetical protein
MMAPQLGVHKLQLRAGGGVSSFETLLRGEHIEAPRVAQQGCTNQNITTGDPEKRGWDSAPILENLSGLDYDLKENHSSETPPASTALPHTLCAVVGWSLPNSSRAHRR